MAATATAPNANHKASAKPAPKDPNRPPDERFWVRYSEHGELPLSAVTSFCLHLIVVILVVLFAVFGLGKLFFNTNTTPPVTPVQLGGGGGDADGSGDGKAGGINEKDPRYEDPAKQSDYENPKRPDLSPQEEKAVHIEFDNDPNLKIYSTNEQFKAIARLNKDLRSKLREGVNGKGRESDGAGGGTGGGKGPGEGKAVGDKKGNISVREARMLRWSMTFNTRSGTDYLAQLRDLGAIIAVPSVENPAEYRLYELTGKAPFKPMDKDLREINRIYWVDNKPSSVAALMRAMGLNYQPDHFVAFMPEELETKLFDMEKARFKGNENDIKETKFSVVRGGGGKYMPRCDHVTAK